MSENYDLVPKDALAQLVDLVSAKLKEQIPKSRISDFPATWAWSAVSGKPTTLAGYGVTAVPEGLLTWGGKNFSDAYGPVDAAMVSDLGADRMRFLKPAGVEIEYSRDGGATWTDYGATEEQKRGLFATDVRLYIGKSSTAGASSADYQLRVTLSFPAAGLYTTLNKIVVYVSTSGSTGCWCAVTARTKANLDAGSDTWSSRWTDSTGSNRQPISGWSGYNVINIADTQTYGNFTSQYAQLRLTFGCTGFSGNYSGLSVRRIMGFGGVGWTTPSTMAKTGHLYAADVLQNATFPGTVTATQLKSSAAAGTAPLTVASTTLVTSLNADLLDGQHGSYYGKASDVTALQTSVSGLQTGVGTLQTGVAALQGYFSGGSAKTAEKLSAVRKLWGQSFDGSADVSGSITMDNNTFLQMKDSAGTPITLLSLTTGNTLYVGATAMISNDYPVRINGSSIRLLTRASDGSATTMLYVAGTGAALNGSLVLTADKVLSIYDANGTARQMVGYNTTYDNGAFGYGPYAVNRPVAVYGGTVVFWVRNAANTGGVQPLTLNWGGPVVPSGFGLKIGEATLSWDADAQMLKVDKGFYSTGAVSAIGASGTSGGSGTGGIDAEALAAALADYVTLATAQTVSGAKTLTGGLTVGKPQTTEQGAQTRPARLWCSQSGLVPAGQAAEVDVTLPARSGTVALTSDLRVDGTLITRISRSGAKLRVTASNGKVYELTMTEAS